ncbi:hypothetical protein OB03_06700 [Brevundimonas sp. GN22]
MTIDEAAEWMLQQFKNCGFLYQETAASYLLQYNKEQLAYYDANSNACVGKDVLKAFNKLTPQAVYERSDKFWRMRLTTDQPGRQQ